MRFMLLALLKRTIWGPVQCKGRIYDTSFYLEASFMYYSCLLYMLSFFAPCICTLNASSTIYNKKRSPGFSKFLSRQAL